MWSGAGASVESSELPAREWVLLLGVRTWVSCSRAGPQQLASPAQLPNAQVPSQVRTIKTLASRVQRAGTPRVPRQLQHQQPSPTRKPPDGLTRRVVARNAPYYGADRHDPQGPRPGLPGGHSHGLDRCILHHAAARDAGAVGEASDAPPAPGLRVLVHLRRLPPHLRAPAVEVRPCCTSRHRLSGRPCACASMWLGPVSTIRLKGFGTPGGVSGVLVAGACSAVRRERSSGASNGSAAPPADQEHAPLLLSNGGGAAAVAGPGDGAGADPAKPAPARATSQELLRAAVLVRPAARSQLRSSRKHHDPHGHSEAAHPSGQAVLPTCCPVLSLVSTKNGGGGFVSGVQLQF